MRNAFLKGLKTAGYLENEVTINGNTVGLKFNKTRTPQPISRTIKTDWLIERKNKLLCDNYHKKQAVEKKLIEWVIRTKWRSNCYTRLDDTRCYRGNPFIRI